MKNVRKVFTAALILGGSLGLQNCGGHSLVLQPAKASASTGPSFYVPVYLTATYRDGSVPSSVRWSTSDACVSIDPDWTQNTNTVICNFSCVGQRTGTITATAGGASADSVVTCTWNW